LSLFFIFCVLPLHLHSPAAFDQPFMHCLGLIIAYDRFSGKINFNHKLQQQIFTRKNFYIAKIIWKKNTGVKSQNKDKGTVISRQQKITFGNLVMIFASIS